MTITVLGTGYVGLTSATVFAAAGFTTYIVDINLERLESVKNGKSFFYEEGLDPLISRCVRNGTLIPTSSYAKSVPRSDLVFSCVGTPDNPDGSTNLTYIFSAAEEAARHMQAGTVFVQKSTVPVGTGAKLEGRFAEAKKQIHYIASPEFMREGSALSDTLWFDRIVAGSHHRKALDAVISVYKTVQGKRDAIAELDHITAPKNPPQGDYITTSINSAELIKVTANAFLALKISFANSIAKLADKSGADVNEVMDAVGADPRIGRAFLNAGRGYGGGCFPKDVSGLISSSMEHGVDMDIMQAATQVNNSMPGYIAEKLQHAFGGDFTGKHVAVLGLAFKSGTSDTRRSPGITLANMLIRRGAAVTTYDPEAMKEAEAELLKEVSSATTTEEALQGAHAVLVVTEWPDFITYPANQYATLLAQDAIFVDCMNRFDPRVIKAAGLRYVGVGRGAPGEEEPK